MKLSKLLTLLFFAGILFSCQKEEEVIQNDAANDLVELASDLSIYARTPFGLYKGVSSTADALNRGVTEIKILNEQRSSATITYLNGDVEFFKGFALPSEGNNSFDLLFQSPNNSFNFTVGLDGKSPTTTNVTTDSKPSFIALAKEEVRGAVVPLTGSFSSNAQSDQPASGTWSVIFATGDGEGDDTDITTQVIFNLVDYGSVTGNFQTGCLPAGNTTTCTIGGAYTAVATDLSWDGTHIYTNLGDCSSSSGTWAALSAGNVELSGSFITDTQCVPPVNDLCADALPILCDDSFAVSTDLATNTDAGVSCGANTNAGIWYVYTDSGSVNDIEVSLAGSTFDTTLNVYTGTCDALVCLAGNDDANGFLTSEVTFQEIGDGTTEYFIYASAFGATASGTLFVSVTCLAPAGGAPGDTFDDPLSLSPSSEGTGCAVNNFIVDLNDTTNGGFSDSPYDSNCGGFTDIFYEVVTTTSGLLATSGLGNPTITAYDLTGTELSCVASFGSLALSGWTVGDIIIIQVAAIPIEVGFCLEAFTIPLPTFVPCGVDFVDIGGNPGLYDDVQLGIDQTYLVDAGSGNFVFMDFSVFDLEFAWDYMRFYDGIDTDASQIVLSVGGEGVVSSNGNNGFTGTSLENDQIVSSGQYLTIVFQSDTWPGGGEGWVASVTCDPINFTDGNVGVSRGQQQTGPGLVNTPATQSAINAKLGIDSSVKNKK
jgi:hypothetical protein